MLSMPILNGRIGKWVLALSEFDLRYESAKAVKGQVIADFITHHHEKEIKLVDLTPWTLFFDGSTCKQGGGIGIVLISPRGASFEFAFPIEPTSTNDQAEYQAIMKGLQFLYEVKAEAVEIFGDSQLVINQLLGLYECKDDVLREYYESCQRLLDCFSSVVIKHIPRNHNQEANRLAQSAFGYRQSYEALNNDLADEIEDWRTKIIKYLRDPSR
jgi:ribonuclease HI